MKVKKTKPKKTKIVGTTFITHLGEDSWTYIKTIVDVLREPVLILDADLRILSANKPFYDTFKVEKKDTENKIVYEIGNGQWDIPNLRKLLENVLPKHTFFRGFEVAHEFPTIGEKTMILNARQIHCKKDPKLEQCPPIILLAIEDITEMMNVAQKLADHTSTFEKKVTEKTQDLETHIFNLEKELSVLKKA